MSEEDLKEIKPIGEFILNNAYPTMLPDGGYYHYSDVCTLLKKYAETENLALKAEVERLRELPRRILIEFNNFKRRVRKDRANVGLCRAVFVEDIVKIFNEHGIEIRDGEKQ
jgi:hypothetical protein